MATPILASSPRRQKILLRVTGLVLLTALVLVVGATGWFYYQARASLPQVDGHIEIRELSAPVRVIRDAQGVPHIRAANLHDLLFAQGYVTAQDRLWQMDAIRRAAFGELSEIVGPAALEHDRNQRFLLFRSTTERAWDALPTATAAQFDAYTEGVNAFIASHRDHLPIEFRLLRYAPRAWSSSDSLGLGLFLHEMLTHGAYRRQLVRERVLAKLGPELTADLYPNSSWHDHPPDVDAKRLDEGPLNEDDDNDDDAPLMRTILEGPAPNLGGAPPKPLLLGWGFLFGVD